MKFHASMLPALCKYQEQGHLNRIAVVSMSKAQSPGVSGLFGYDSLEQLHFIVCCSQTNLGYSVFIISMYLLTDSGKFV